jgi:hypothetical protein
MVIRLGRRPIIREAIIDVLRSSECPLRFGEIKREAAHKLNRKVEDVNDQNIADNLLILTNKGQVEKAITSGDVTYELTNSYYKMQNKTLVKSLLDSADVKDFYPRFEDESNPPFTAFFDNLDALTDPMRSKTVQYFIPHLANWSTPLDLIERRMLESFTDLPIDEQKGVAKLLAHAYWYGIQSLVKEFGFSPLDESLLKCKNYALQCIDGAEERGDLKRIEAERAIIEIIELTEKIISKKNLKELLDFFYNTSLRIKQLQGHVLDSVGQFMCAGEKVYDNFLEFHNCVVSALLDAELIPKGRKRGYPFLEFRHFMNYSDVWDEIISSIISQFNTTEELQGVNGDLSQSLKMVKNNEKYLWSLIKLPFQSRMFIVYLWGYPEVFKIADKDFLPIFEKWMEALRTGYLDHRSWIFDEKAITTVINAFKAVKRGKAPPEGLIDIEHWTILDLYRYHPRGKEVSFWKELLIELNKRLQTKTEKRELSRHILSTLQNGY